MTDKPRDWSEKDLRRMIIDQRRFLWRPDTIDRIALSLNLKQGMTAVDAGCGLGYLGWTFWRHFGRGGTYIGLDCSGKLLAEALGLAEEWSEGGAARFACASACSLPLPDGYSDLTMCQTLLMHLSDPEEALAEMVRVTRPGGAVMCMEPDNVSAGLAIPYSSVPGRSVEDQLYWAGINLIFADGARKLGRGDSGIGKRVPRMMARAGLTGIDVRANDTALFLQPPYETEQQRYRLEKLREGLEEKDEENERRRWDESRECFIAGGGSRSAFYRMKTRWMAERDSRTHMILEQIASGSYFHGQSPASFYCITGFVPE